ncbi:hypothetical protein M758_2G029800 [Ceratodon purpureus]|uniref:GDSL esterase/lipase n=1 Tax=Ceratodon purpureus TaxID=3225 RepID=A0A8T0IRM5_CERPU|nr:hypothetical protein KC19_2G030300 [Ceratodon purpureus]KAG0625125.1 hypothetical protein M758_2G029800 [Ceratodon purpureus]
MTTMEGKLVLLLSVLMVVTMSPVVNAQGKKAPATFVFGDSLVDVGNNNYFFTLASADHKPYGIDRADKVATGRFCNGKIIPDLVNDYLGTPYPLPVLAPEATGGNLLHGVNYASAGAGIQEETGQVFIGRVTMSQQFDHFTKTKQQIALMVGQQGMEELIHNGIYSFTVGGNDYINNYMALTTNTKNMYTLPQYLDRLITLFRGQLKTAYGLGMRKFIISNMGPIGCAPSVLSTRSKNGECVQEVNDYAINFNNALKPMLESVQTELPGSVILYANAFGVVKSIIDNPLKYGFTEPVTTACCGVGKFNGIDGACRTIGNLCADRTKSVFWDAFHPTETVNRMSFQVFLNGGPDVISPMNVKQLLAM